MCTHAHMCVHTRMYAHMHVHTHAHVHAGAFLHALCVQAYTCTMYPCTRARVCSYTYKYPHTCVDLHSGLHVHVSTKHALVCPCTHIHVSTHVYTCTRCVCTHACVYMYDMYPCLCRQLLLPRDHPGLQRQCLVLRRPGSLPMPLCAHAAEGLASGTYSHSQLLPARIFYSLEIWKERTVGPAAVTTRTL